MPKKVNFAKAAKFHQIWSHWAQGSQPNYLIVYVRHFQWENESKHKSNFFSKYFMISHYYRRVGSRQTFLVINVQIGSKFVVAAVAVATHNNNNNWKDNTTSRQTKQKIKFWLQVDTFVVQMNYKVYLSQNKSYEKIRFTNRNFSLH